MMWFFAILIVLALGGVAVVAAGRGAPMVAGVRRPPDSLVPADGPITADDLRRIRFPMAFRGYRMAEVDACSTGSPRSASRRTPGRPRGRRRRRRD